VGNYVRFGPEVRPQLCPTGPFFTACGPGDYEAERGVLYRNAGGRFRDVTRAWGFSRTSGKTLGVAAAPLAGSRQPALALANDQVPGDLFMLGNSPAPNRGVASGTAYARDGKVYGGMGLDWGDYDNDGDLDLVVGTFQSQAKPVFRNDRGLFAALDTDQIGMRSSVPFVTWGTQWLDFDNDGWLDLLFTNGHVQDNVAEVDLLNGHAGGAVFRQPILLYRNTGAGRFTDARARLSGGAERPIVGRGLAAGDYDNDGRMDALAVDSEGRPVLLHNEGRPAGNWLLVRLLNRGGRDDYQALVTIEAGGRRLVRHCHADGSYLSSSDPRVHFGLGKVSRVDRLRVRWASGHTQTYGPLSVNRSVTLRERAGRR
jgi:hypothetical protein